MSCLRRVSVLAVCIGLAGASARSQTAGTAAGARLAYPATRTVDVVDDYHGTKVPDPYRWLEDLDSPAVASWVKAENALSSPYLAALPGRDALVSRITALYDYPRTSVPFWEGGRFFYTKNSGLQKQSVWYSRASRGGKEELLLDPNALSPDGSTALAGVFPAPDGRHFAYALSEGGSDWRTVRVHELATGRETDDVVTWVRAGDPSWTRDGGGFFYSRYPEPLAGKKLEAKLEHHMLYYHRLGTPQAEDVKIYERPDHPAWLVFGSVDETGRYLLVLTAPGSEKNEVYLADLGDPLHPDVAAAIRPVVTGHDANYYPLGVQQGELFLLVDKDAPRRMVVAGPIATPDPSHWTTVIPEGETPIQDASLVAGQISVLRLQDVASVVTLYSLDGRSSREVEMPGVGTASVLVGRFDRSEIFYDFETPLQPSTVFSYDAQTGTSRPFEPPSLSFDPAKLTSERVFYTSKDGTRVPMFLTFRRDLVKNGMNPTMLYAYGGFAIAIRPRFRPDVIAWVEQGGVYAVACLRGGDEYGEAWHQAGQFEKKQNVFDDFIAAAEYLVRERYTSPAALAINGGSNGGLLVGAVMTQRPDLFAAAVPQVGVMDMLRYDRFTGGASWATEYGTSSDPKAFAYLKAYSPLHNIKPGTCYPATLVTTADHDDRVVPSHSFKFTATLQKAQASADGCSRPVLIRVQTQGSHGYRPLDKRIVELADIGAFAARFTGLKLAGAP